MEIKIQNSICENCKYFKQEYYKENGTIMRYLQGFCKCRHRRKQREQTCMKFSPRETETEEDLLFRRQELYAEIEELTGFLKKIKALADVVTQIQDIVNKK